MISLGKITRSLMRRVMCALSQQCWPRVASWQRGQLCYPKGPCPVINNIAYHKTQISRCNTIYHINIFDIIPCMITHVRHNITLHVISSSWHACMHLHMCVCMCIIYHLNPYDDMHVLSCQHTILYHNCVM